MVRRSITSPRSPRGASVSAASSARVHELPGRGDGDVASRRARCARRRTARNARPPAPRPSLANSALVSSMMHRVAGAQRRLHQPLGVRRRRRQADDQARDMRPDRVIGAANGAARRCAPRRRRRGPPSARSSGRSTCSAASPPAATIWPAASNRKSANIRSAMHAHAGRRGAERGAGEAQLGDRRVDHPLGAELLPQALGVRESAAALAGALAEIEDVRIAPHLLGDAVAHRIEPARLGRVGRPAAARSASGGLIGSAKTWRRTVAGSGSGERRANSSASSTIVVDPRVDRRRARSAVTTA